MKQIILLLEKGIDEIPEAYIQYYENLLEIGKSHGVSISISSPYDYNQASKEFKTSWTIENGTIIKDTGRIIPDIVWYKSNAVHNIVLEIEKNHDFINYTDYILLAADKYETSLRFPALSPATIKAGDIKGNNELLNKINTDKVVLKPNWGVGGKGIYINTKEELLHNIKKGEDLSDFIAQDFIDSSQGIRGLIKGTFDLRFVVVGNKISYCYFRTPPKGDFRCNYSLGGDMEMVNISKIPENILKQVKKLVEKLSKKASIYSIDITCEGEKVYLVELNSSPGVTFNEKDKVTQEQFFGDLVIFLQNH